MLNVQLYEPGPMYQTHSGAQSPFLCTAPQINQPDTLDTHIWTSVGLDHPNPGHFSANVMGKELLLLPFPPSTSP